jgi:hypothetical protein
LAPSIDWKVGLRVRGNHGSHPPKRRTLGACQSVRRRPASESLSGELPKGDRGFEFFTFAEPDLDAPVPLWTARSDGLVWEQDGTAKLRVLVARVSQDFE